MNGFERRTAIVIDSRWGQPTCAELESLAAAGERPRKDYVELARTLDADVIDVHYMSRRATPLAWSIAQKAHMRSGQVVETFLRQRRYRHICAWSDQMGLLLALLFKLAGGRRDLVVIAQWTSRPKRALLFTRLKIATHVRAFVYTSSVQRDIAATRLGIPRSKLHLALPPVDDRFWYPEDQPVDSQICAVGWENRDYPTLLRAVKDLALQVKIEVSNIGQPALQSTTEFLASRAHSIAADGLPPNVKLHQLGLKQLRQLYARSRFVVLPLNDVPYGAGSSALTEAMAMGKAVIVTRTRGQVDYVRDGEHGLYVPPNDPAALRSAIEYLASHPGEAERMGRAGRALVEQHLTLDSYVASLATLLRGHYEGLDEQDKPRAEHRQLMEQAEARPASATALRSRRTDS